MRRWLVDAVLESHDAMGEQVYGYCVGRGLPSSIIDDLVLGVWVEPETPAPEEGFRDQYGARGNYFRNRLTIPVWAPSGKLLGVEARRWDGPKEVSKFFLPEIKWTPSFIGMCPAAMKRISDGGDVWLVEGLFDLALTHVVPSKDVVLACIGAHLSRENVHFLQRFVRSSATVHVAFDEDATGRNQSRGYTDQKTGRWVPGVVERLSAVGTRTELVSYRGGKDPGEIWERGGRRALSVAFNL